MLNVGFMKMAFDFRDEAQRVAEAAHKQESESLNLLKALQKSALAALAPASDSRSVSLLGRKRRRQSSPPPLPSTSTAPEPEREAKRARRTGSAADLFARRTSNDSISSSKSAGSKTSSANSRAAEMMRLRYDICPNVALLVFELRKRNVFQESIDNLQQRPTAR